MFYPTESRADLHVHSKYSDRPSEWFLRRLGAPECYVEPEDIYRTARENGMDFVTIADHNCIKGALEIAHLPGTFISCEATTYFPENGCKLHCLVHDITREQFRMIQELRESIYELHAYLNAEDIIHSIAHPMFRVNDRLTIEQLEKLILMFKRFEGLNGTREARSSALTQAVLGQLTPEIIEAMADRHDMAPTGPDPWVKHFTGGSDDHSGAFAASAFTVTPHANNTEEFLAHLRRGDHQASGGAGGSLHLAHCLYRIAYGYYRSRFLDVDGGKPNLIESLFRKLIGEAPPVAPKQSWKLTSIVTGFLTEYIKSRKLRHLNDAERMLVEEFTDMFSQEDLRDTASQPSPDRLTFDIASKISHQLGYRLLGRLHKSFEEGRVLDGLQALAALAPAAMSVAPYLASFMTQHKDDGFLREVADRYLPTKHPLQRTDRKAWITDTFNDVNGVCRTIQTVSELAQRRGRRLTVLTCLDDVGEAHCDVKNFQPVGMFELPEYEHQKIAFPPFLDIIEYLERHQITELIVSTPGPMGLTALAAARLLGLRTVAIYHTDFPQYVRLLTDDDNLEQLTWGYMRWFYEQVDHVLAPSQHYRNLLIDHGLEPNKVSLMIRGVDLDRFDPESRDRSIWRRWSLDQNTFTYLYVGRVSTDKNVERLLQAFALLHKRGERVQLAVVGDGPQREELEKKYAGLPIRFTGYLQGQDLKTTYASADAMVFPSTTDTFGNVVLEAQASGLPVIVSDEGGPCEIVSKSESGVIVDVNRPERLAEAMTMLRTDRDFHRKLIERGLENARSHTWDRVLEQLWNAGNDGECDERRSLARAS